MGAQEESVLPYEGLTDEELLREVFESMGTTAREMELAVRLEHLLEQLGDRHGSDPGG